ncbi:hypothetical protein L0244_19310, partial [bacterium]|nr:hypothetical protein [bacterium]
SEWKISRPSYRIACHRRTSRENQPHRPAVGGSLTKEEPMTTRQQIRKQFIKKAKAVTELFKKNPPNIHEEMEKLGFEWVDDGMDDIERMEEEAATPRNEREQRLVDYFKGWTELNDEVLHLFLAEKNSEDTNDALFRKFFKHGNPCLKKLLLYGLQKNPTDRSLLMDLVYFNEFQLNMGELKDCFIRACLEENDLESFEKIARDFWVHTQHHSFEALPELLKLFDENSAKSKIVRKLIKEQNSPPKLIHF